MELTPHATLNEVEEEEVDNDDGTLIFFSGTLPSLSKESTVQQVEVPLISAMTEKPIISGLGVGRVGSSPYLNT